MAGDELLKPTLHVEVRLDGNAADTAQIESNVGTWLRERFARVAVGMDIDHIEHVCDFKLADGLIHGIEIAAYSGPENKAGFYELETLHLDVQSYKLCTGLRRTINQPDELDSNHERMLELPNILLHEAWNSLVFDDALPARLLRYLVRMTDLMGQPGLNISTFNWNRLCLLHGPPGSGKSTLCRALAQKLSIRLFRSFASSMLVEIDTNGMLSKYFGESGKLIEATFERIAIMARARNCLVCVVMDEIETIAGRRDKSASGNECRDGLRATNQLLTALDRLRNLPNVVVLCTSNLIDAIDPAFLDRVDIKQLIPSPSPAAIYNIFRSCLNELVRSSLVGPNASEASASCKAVVQVPSSSPEGPVTRRASKGKKAVRKRSPSPEPWTLISTPSIPTLADMKLHLGALPVSPGERLWCLAQKCEGFSGRTLRRLPILGLAMYTGVGQCLLDDAVGALEAAVNQELMAMRAVVMKASGAQAQSSRFLRSCARSGLNAENTC